VQKKDSVDEKVSSRLGGWPKMDQSPFLGKICQGVNELKKVIMGNHKKGSRGGKAS